MTLKLKGVQRTKYHTWLRRRWKRQASRLQAKRSKK